MKDRIKLLAEGIVKQPTMRGLQRPADTFLAIEIYGNARNGLSEHDTITSLNALCQEEVLDTTYFRNMACYYFKKGGKGK